MTVFSNAGQDEPEKIHLEAAKFMRAEEVPCELQYSQNILKLANNYGNRNARRLLQVQFWV